MRRVDATAYRVCGTFIGGGEAYARTIRAAYHIALSMSRWWRRHQDTYLAQLRCCEDAARPAARGLDSPQEARLMADYPKVQHYLLVMHGDVEPELRGPFTDDERTDRARLWRKENGDEDGLFRVDAAGHVEIASFTGAEVDEWEAR